MTPNGSNQVTVAVAITFPSSMTGTVDVQALGTDSQGQEGPMSDLTNFTVTGPPTPQLLTWQMPPTYVIASGATVTVMQTVALVGGATGPVTVGTVTSSPAGVTVNASSISVEVQGQVATISMNVTVPVNSGSGSNYYSLTFPVSAPGVTSQTASVSISVPPTGVTPVGISMAGPVLTSLAQGNSWTFPITITPLGGETVTVQGPPPAGYFTMSLPSGMSNSISVPQGGSVQASFVVNAFNGYVGVRC